MITRDNLFIVFLLNILFTHSQIPYLTFQPKVDEDVELLDDQDDTHAIAAYYADNLLDDETKVSSSSSSSSSCCCNGSRSGSTGKGDDSPNHIKFPCYYI